MKAIFGWLAFVLIAMAVGFKVLPQQRIDQKAAGPGESGEAAKVIDGAFEDKSSEQVLIQSSELTAGDAQFKAAVADVTERLEGTNGVDDVVSPLPSERADLGRRRLRARDVRAAGRLQHDQEDGRGLTGHRESGRRGPPAAADRAGGRPASLVTLDQSNEEMGKSTCSPSRSR